MDTTELKRLAAEASMQHGIRLDPDDPIMVVVTLNRLVLESSLEEALRSIQKTTAEFHQAAERVQIRAGAAVGQEVRDCVAKLKDELNRDVQAARLNARQLISELHNSYSRSSIIRWVGVGLLAGAALFVGGLSAGLFLR
jgi:CHASE3 domain sensor protein